MKTLKQFKEEVTTGAVAGAGDDSSTVVVSKEAHRKYKQKNASMKKPRKIMVP